jgi:hypothetical protein
LAKLGGRRSEQRRAAKAAECIFSRAPAFGERVSAGRDSGAQAQIVDRRLALGRSLAFAPLTFEIEPFIF